VTPVAYRSVQQVSCRSWKKERAADISQLLAAILFVVIVEAFVFNRAIAYTERRETLFWRQAEVVVEAQER
jgi:ABC-type nitrate/sulfonate/bicarbonate transport system permease component